MRFAKPEIEIIRFENADIITSSALVFGSYEEALNYQFGPNTNTHSFDCPDFSGTIGDFVFERVGNGNSGRWRVPK